MTPGRQSAPVRPSDPRAAAALEWLALVVILLVLTARPFVSEMPFRSWRGLPPPTDRPWTPQAPEELARLTFSMLLLSGGALWALAAAIRGRARCAGGVFASLAAALVAWSVVSCFRANDARAAWTGWLEQAGMLAGAFVMVQLAARPDRRGLLLAILVALAGTMGLKALFQATVEAPERIAQFAADPEGQLAAAGIQPGTSAARMFQKRLSDPGAYGWLFLSNTFASLMLVLVSVAAGATVEKFRRARQALHAGPALKPGEVHLPTLAVLPMAAVAVLAAAGLGLSWSKGGIVAGVVALPAAAVAYRWSGFFARHHRKALAVATGIMLAAVGGLTAWGVARGGLPTRSLQVRWEYWTGAAGVIRQVPLLGVGAGNFGAAYVRHRLPQAAESTKLAHNALLDASCQFGLPAAGLYLAMLAWLAVTISRPGDASDENLHPPTGGRIGPAAWLVLVPLAVVAVRGVWAGSRDASLLVVDAVVPAAVLAVLLAAAMWTGPRLAPADLDGRATRIGLGFALGGMLLHNLVDSTLWSPATGTLFWVCAGAAAGAAAVARERMLGPWARIGLAAAPLVLLGAGAMLLVRPVLGSTRHIRQAEIAGARGDLDEAARRLRQAADADPLDPFPPAELSRLLLAQVAKAGPDQLKGLADQAVGFAEAAWGRTRSAENANLLAGALWLRDEPSGLLRAWRLHRREDLSQLEASLRAAIERLGTTPALLNALGEVQYLSGQTEQAYQTISTAAALAGDAEMKLYDHLGDLAWQLGRSNEAISSWAAYVRLSAAALKDSPAADFALQAVELDPMDEPLRASAARLLLAAGRIRQARENLEELFRIDGVRPADSDLRLTADEIAALRLLERKIHFAGLYVAPATTASAPAAR